MAILKEGLVYLFDSIFQVESVAGKPCVGGHVEVYLAGTDTRYITYQDWDGTENPFKIPLRNDGRAVILVSPINHYDAYIYDSYGNLVCSRLNIIPQGAGGDITVEGGVITNIKNTDQTLDVVLSSTSGTVNEYTINSNHKPLGVEEPLYFVKDDEEATIIGFNTESLPDIVASAISGISGSFATSSMVVSATSGKQDILTPGQYIDINDNLISVTGVQPAGSYATTQDFSNLSGYINTHEEAWTSANEYSAGNGIDITNNVIAVTGQFGKIYSGAGVINVDNENDVISADLSNYYDKQTVDDHIASAVSSVPQNEYSAGANINVTDYVISGKDWTTDIQNATSGLAGKLDASAFTAFTATADVTPYSAGNNVTIENHVISLTGDLGKVYTGSGYVVVDNTNDKIGLTSAATDKLDSFIGEYDLSAGNNVEFRLVGQTMYIDAQGGSQIDYTPIIEDI